MEEVEKVEGKSRLFKISFSVILIVLIIIAGFYFFNQISNVVQEDGGDTLVSNSAGIVSNASANSGVKIDYSNLPEMLAKNEVIKALPTSAVILLRFYNFDTGERVWERSYVLQKASAEEVSDVSAIEEDIILSLHSKYLAKLTSTNFCNTIKQANENRDLGFETELSTVSLGWKYKSVYEYKSCFGM